MERQNFSGSIKIHIAGDNLSIPEEIVEELLSRLPVKSLLKFRCVSKTWRSLIDSESFIKFHLQKSLQNPCFSYHRVILNPVRPRVRQHVTCSWRSLLEESIDSPFEPDVVRYRDRQINLVGCCNGLVCLLHDKKIFTLWNPSTRMSLILPDPRIKSIRHWGFGSYPMYGFGYVESSDDYKVFSLITTSVCPFPDGRVYSLKNDTWETMGVYKPPYGLQKSGKFVSGNLHWLRIVKEDRGIVSFDLKNEVFGEVELPNRGDGDAFVARSLGVIDGCLSVLGDSHNSQFDVWVMKDYGVKESWVNIITFSNIRQPPESMDGVSSFCRGPNGELLLINKQNLIIYYYSQEDNVFRRSHMINIDEVCKFIEGGVYVESLFSLGPDARQEIVSDGEEGSNAE